jgi:hypothetical protein
MDNYLIKELRERLVERYDAIDLIEILDLTVEDVYEAFFDKIVDNPIIIEELGLIDL